MSNIVTMKIKDFCRWARVRSVDLARASGMTRQNIYHHSSDESETVVEYNKKTNLFKIKNDHRTFASGKIKHVEIEG